MTYLENLILNPAIPDCAMDEKALDMQEMGMHSDFPFCRTGCFISMSVVS
jgi:hypothetical protein